MLKLSNQTLGWQGGRLHSSLFSFYVIWSYYSGLVLCLYRDTVIRAKKSESGYFLMPFLASSSSVLYKKSLYNL
jgi:hypothetical protein